MGERPVLEIGVDLLGDRVAAVGLLGLDQDQWTVGEHGVVAVEAEQLLLTGTVNSAGAGFVLGLRRLTRRTISWPWMWSGLRRLVNAV